METIRGLRANRNAFLSLAITGGECLLDLQTTLTLLELTKKLAGDFCQTRIYTNGDRINRSVLKKLQAVRLDEIRISLKPGEGNFRGIALAKEYIPRVMVETPVFPDREEEMKRTLLKLNALNIFGVNLLEFVFCCRNVHAYKKRGCKIANGKPNDLSIPYPYSYPVHGSEAVCFNLLEFAAKERFTLGVHYCSLKNKRYGNPNEKLKSEEIVSAVKAEFIKNKKHNRERFISRHWADHAFKKSLRPQRDRDRYH